MNLLYVAVDPSLYTHYFANEACPQGMYPFPDNVDKVPNLPPAPTTMNALPTKKIAHNPTQNTQQRHQHECCAYQHPPKPHTNGIQTLSIIL
jgi:hypothetical protein